MPDPAWTQPAEWRGHVVFSDQHRGTWLPDTEVIQRLEDETDRQLHLVSARLSWHSQVSNSWLGQVTAASLCLAGIVASLCLVLIAIRITVAVLWRV